MSLSPGDRIRAAFRWWYCDRPTCDGKPHGRWRHNHARAGQRLRTGAWLVWLLLAGRGYGKTRTGAEATVALMLGHPGCRVALVGSTFDDARDVMVEGPSGLESVLRRYGVPYVWNRSLGHLVLDNGSRAEVFSAEKPRKLRGPEHHYAWCDELAWWSHIQATWDNLLFGLRAGGKGHQPHVIVTTTPRPVKLLRKLLSRPDAIYTRGSTLENADNLPDVILDELVGSYAGTHTGRQELDGELLDEAEGASWTRALLDLANRPVALPDTFSRVVVAMDPAMTSKAKTKGDETDSNRTAYAVVARGPAPAGWSPSKRLLAESLARGLTKEGLLALPHLYVLHSEAGRHRPGDACRRAAELQRLWDAEAVVAEVDNGGDWIGAVLQAVAPGCPYRDVRASGKGSKLQRAEHPVALYEQERVHHVGDHQELEDEQTAYTGAATDTSPDLMDALVWACTDLVPPVARRRKRNPARQVS